MPKTWQVYILKPDIFLTNSFCARILQSSCDSYVGPHGLFHDFLNKKSNSKVTVNVESAEIPDMYFYW